MAENIITGKGISYTYEGGRSAALDGIDLDIEKGSFTAILGQNGSGKSTLAKLFNAMLPLQTGSLEIAGIDAKNEKDIWLLRRKCGMVFQNPDNQFVSTIAEEDVAFGLENYEVPREEIPGRVAAALKLTDLEGYEKRSPHSLSGGEKQRLALSGVLALDPEIIIFDEVTSMLDPMGRSEILHAIKNIHIKNNETIIMITHNAEEALYADRLILMKEGKIIATGAPQEILIDIELIKKADLLPLITVSIYHDLLKDGIKLNTCPLTIDELREEVCRYR